MKYNVIKIIDEYTIMINAGYKQNISVGDEIRVYSEGEDIFDIDGKKLGIVEIIKDELEVVEIFENFSVCQKIKISEKNVLQPVNFIIRKKSNCKLNVVKEEISNIDYRDKKPIKIGDLVKKLEKY